MSNLQFFLIEFGNIIFLSHICTAIKYLSMKKTIITALLCASFGIFAPKLAAQEEAYVPTPENIASRQEFSDMKFGIFLHWGIYSMFGQGEWYMQNANIDWREYEKVASGFYPSKFDAKAWVEAFKASGAKYITFTSRHHDSFSMWKTAESSYNVVDATPFGRDVIGELAEACHEQGMRLHLYYSHLDWRREDYPVGRTGLGTKRDLKPNWQTYLKFMKGQLTELLTNYGEIGAIWFDGVWDHDQDSIPFDWSLREQYDLIHQLQPRCLVGNNHHLAVFPGEDIQIFERDIPGENKAGLSGQEISVLPLETCQTMNGMWGYKITDQNYKSTDELIRLLVGTSGKGANLLLNIGPQPNGELPATALSRLKEMGEWLGKYGESIYGTTAGEVAPQPWGVTTRKGNVLYVHVLDLDDSTLELAVNGKIKSAVSLVDGQKATFKQTKDKTMLTLPAHEKTVDYIVAITTK